MAKTSKRTAKDTKVVLQLKVKGPGIKRGRIPIPELIEICRNLQQAVNRQAEALEGRESTMHPGPKSDKVRQECTLDLVGLGEGSAVLDFDQAKPQANLPAYGQVMNLGHDAIREVAEGLRALKAGRRPKLDQGVLQSLDALSHVVNKKVVTSIDWIVPSRPGVRGVRVTINQDVKARVERELKSPTTDETTIDGVLEMADFKPEEYRCRIHPAVGPAVVCTFDEDLEDEIYRNMRRTVQLKGTATFNPNSNRIESIEITSLKPMDTLAMNATAFSRGSSLDELARAQAVDPVKNPRAFAGGWPDDDDVDAAVADIYRHRY